jgi:hypothetical protein
MKRLSDYFTRMSRGWVAILATSVFILFMALVLPGQAAKAEQTSGGAGSPDTSFWYSADDLYQFAEDYGDAGRAAYVHARWTFDLVYPLVYTFFLIASVSWLFAYAFPTSSRWHLANTVPFAGMIFDYLENGAATLVMVRYPQASLLAATAAPILTGLKWLFVVFSFLLLVIGIVKALQTRLTYRQTSI